MKNLDSQNWYPIRVTYSREVKLKSYLDTVGISNFLPMQYKEIVAEGKKKKILTSVIPNLIFIKSSKERIDELKKETEAKNMPMRYMIDRSSRKPMIVPVREMDNFIAVSGTNHEQLIYLTSVQHSLKRGERVRVSAGPFEGVEGEVVRIKHDHRVLVSINGVMSVATAFVHPKLLEHI